MCYYSSHAREVGHHHSADIYDGPLFSAAPAQGKWNAARRQPGPRILAKREIRVSAEANKAVVRGYIEQVWNEHRTDLVEEYMSDDFLHHDAPGITDRESLKNFITATMKAFPDFKVSTE